ncbi:MAG: hypothetical protein ACM3MK_00815 [Chitinophagales bacterium]
MTIVKRITYYFLYVVAFFSVSAFSHWVTRQIFLWQRDTWDPLYALPELFNSLVNILPGLFLGLEQLLRERNRPGKWKLDWARLIVFGVPAFHLDFCYFLSWATNKPLLIPYMPAATLSNVTWIFGGTILGYILVTSIKKEAVVAGDSIECGL